VVLELCGRAGIAFEETDLVVQDLLEAQEVFLTNSIMELMPVCRVERHGVGDEKPGPVYRRLHDLYREEVNG
jgi:branched-subunit amino acid aminotransferase/4-amino-4-deoxychorismate lyase